MTFNIKLAYVQIFGLLLSSFLCSAQLNNLYQGKWKLLKRSIGVSAMHIALLPNDRIVIFDRTDSGPSNITYPQGKCLKNSDCFAHSVEFDPANRNIRPLTLLSDTWCSSGALSPDGVLIQTGGNGEGERVVRYFNPCLDCDWVEHPNALLSPRWYASNQVLPNGDIIVVGGRRQFSYEFIPSHSKQYDLPFLRETFLLDAVPNNLYPFIHLSTDGNLFIFANDRAILLDYINNKVVRRYPVMPGGVSRNYPSTGSSVLLPLSLSTNTAFPQAEVFVCGGTKWDANEKAYAGKFVLASKTCGRLVITVDSSKWEMQEMPLNRLMGDMILLPTGDVLIVNGASRGTAGWGVAREPVLNPILYSPSARTFTMMSPSSIARMYHSSAHLLSDGRVLIGGSNPNSNYNFSTLFPTELSVEAFYPPYLCGNKARPNITRISPARNLAYSQKLEIVFWMKDVVAFDRNNIKVTMVAPSFTTHSFAMNQRLLFLEVLGTRQKSACTYAVECFAPATSSIAPPGHYQLFLVYDGVPSGDNWVHISQ